MFWPVSVHQTLSNKQDQRPINKECANKCFCLVEQGDFQSDCETCIHISNRWTENEIAFWSCTGTETTGLRKKLGCAWNTNSGPLDWSRICFPPSNPDLHPSGVFMIQVKSVKNKSLMSRLVVMSCHPVCTAMSNKIQNIYCIISQSLSSSRIFQLVAS